MRVRFLGTGTSFGVPVVGCDCPACRSDDARDRRTRHGLLIESGGARLLVDTPPELRLQLLRAGVDRIDAVFLSHEHADHTHGIDDLRIFSLRGGAPIPLHVAREFEPAIRRRFSYIWGGGRTQPGSAVPQLDLTPFEDREVIAPAGLELQVVALPHGVYRSYGFRLGDLGVLIDAKSVPDNAMEIFAGVDVLIMNALWFGDPHPGHFSMEEAAATARQLGAARTYLTHIAHRTTHAEIARRLPSGVEPAFDGLVVEL
ncbi:MBL fold metallo-hydrolase [Candidatus Palauibacter sp.]|uniref:MBL fold metallo-hydrolase n=1 Tax=Candidatus Palauibacter sp. TaxID=3101350 RepID=UPI003B5B9E10